VEMDGSSRWKDYQIRPCHFTGCGNEQGCLANRGARIASAIPNDSPKRTGPQPGKLRPLGFLGYAEFRAGTDTLRQFMEKCQTLKETASARAAHRGHLGLSLPLLENRRSAAAFVP